MTTPILQVHGLKKRYGELEAVRGIDFEVGEGEIFALIGPNGAGKTTTLRMVATILRPTEGTIVVDGIDAAADPGRVREVISYLPEEAGAYKNLKAIDYLRFVAEIFFDDRARIDEAIATGREVSGLGDRLDDKLGSYSKGMTRKLLLARTVMTEPRLAILDEPTSGLDVINALELRERVESSPTAACRCCCRATTCSRSSSCPTASRSSPRAASTPRAPPPSSRTPTAPTTSSRSSPQIAEEQSLAHRPAAGTGARR